MRWDASGCGAHTEKATDGAASTWYFAEGAQGWFSTYLLLANPQPTANVATVTWMREGESTVVRQLSAGGGVTHDDRYVARCRAGEPFVRRAGRLRLSRAWPSARCISAAIRRGWAVMRRPAPTSALDELVSGGRRDRKLLHDVHPDRQSGRSASRRHADLSAGIGRGADDDGDAGGGAAPDAQHRRGTSIAGERVGGDVGQRDAADRRRARAVLGIAGVDRVAQQPRSHCGRPAPGPLPKDVSAAADDAQTYLLLVESRDARRERDADVPARGVGRQSKRSTVPAGRRITFGIDGGCRAASSPS